MSDMCAKERVLEELRKAGQPLAAAELFRRLQDLQIDAIQVRRVLLDLVDEQMVRMTSDRAFALAELVPA